jgi:acid phosphatase
MKYISRKIGKWMPGDKDADHRVAVDSRPRLSGIMDTVNATLAHEGKETKLPSEFYDAKMRGYVDKIAVEEWFKGYAESKEYRELGIGGLMGDMVGRMVSVTDRRADPLGILEVGGNGANLGVGRGGEKRITFGLSGAHDTTLAAALTSIGAFDGESWPPFTSHIAFELFKKSAAADISKETPAIRPRETGGNWWAWMTGGPKQQDPTGAVQRAPLEEFGEAKKKQLDGYYVRVRYNDKVMKVPGCKPVGKHLDGDDSFCTLVRTLTSRGSG